MLNYPYEASKAIRCRIIHFLIIICACVCGIIIFAGCSSVQPDLSAEGSSLYESPHTGFYVDGSTLRTADGKPFVMRGINHGYNWFQDKTDVAFDAIAATGANCIRIVLSSGLQWQNDDTQSLKNAIDAAVSRGMVAIVEVHDGTGSDDISVLESIAKYWCEMASVLAGTEKYCILNIANEWCGGWRARRWRDGYTKVIPMIREAGIKNAIMVDAAGWGQFGVSVRSYGAEVFNSDPLRNTMFSIHMYGMSGRWEWLIRYNLEGVTNQNLCVCVGEFGWTHSDGDVKEDYLMQYCDEKNIGYIAWSWKGNSGGVEYLDLAEEWDGSKLSEWGERVVNGIQGKPF